MPQSFKSGHIVVTGVFLFVALAFPFMGIFNKPRTIQGIPILYIYIFTVWIGAVGLMYWYTLPEKPNKPKA
jgi:hypothetical protein